MTPELEALERLKAYLVSRVADLERQRANCESAMMSVGRQINECIFVQEKVEAEIVKLKEGK